MGKGHGGNSKKLGPSPGPVWAGNGIFKCLKAAPKKCPNAPWPYKCGPFATKKTTMKKLILSLSFALLIPMGPSLLAQGIDSPGD